MDLKAEQEKTLATPRLPANFFLRLMFVTFDLVYGAQRTIPKFVVLEILARYPYWAWEDGSYKRLSRTLCSPKRAAREKVDLYLDTAKLGRDSQDNEQWHMLILADIVQQQGVRLGWVRHVLIPLLLAFTYYHFSRLLFALNPAWSFAMNAAFESHAEHEYMLTAQENPDWDQEPVESEYFQFYPQQKSLGDLLRRIALDERDHMYHSLEAKERFLNFPNL